MLGVARHTPCHGFLPGLAHGALFSKRAKARRDMAEGLRPPWIPLSKTAIGRLLSRMPVIIRSHESSGASMAQETAAGINSFSLAVKPLILLETKAKLRIFCSHLPAS
jgi:hypothetical protein